uniref:Battenin n=1 Tax=Xenopsylla cheopis TaxID=163159 RepID=A0A6M2DWD4_XENCH
MVALSEGSWLAILGVVATSFSSGLGEVTFLAHSSKYNKNVISTWSSGTGGAGIVGAVSYAGLTGIGLDPVTTLLVMLVVPVLEGLTFWVLLRKPHEEEQPVQTATGMSVYGSSAATFGPKEANRLTSFKSKLKAIPPLFKYMIPLLLVYLLEYFINQGLFELIYYDNIFIDQKEQYRWLQVDYQIGVFISRSSVNLVQLKQVWLMSVFQFINVLILLFQVLYGYIPNIWIVFAVVLWEGLLGGGAYVNTFYRMSHEIPVEERKFSMSITAIADSLGIALAGWIAIPTHNALCALPKP